MDSQEILQSHRAARKRVGERREYAKKAIVTILAMTPEDSRFSPLDLAAKVAGVRFTDAQMAFAVLRSSGAYSPNEGLNMSNEFVAETIEEDPLEFGERIIPKAALQEIVTMRIDASASARSVDRAIAGLGR